jgi:hypothetical protein
MNILKLNKMKSNCYDCVHKLDVPGDAHSRCNNVNAKVDGHPQGIRNGWFMWPINFDPIWLISCDGFSNDPKDKKPITKIDPLQEILSMLR